MNRPGTVEIKSEEILSLHTLDTFLYAPTNRNGNLPKKIQLVLQRKKSIMKDIIAFYEVGSVVNYNDIEDDFFLKAVINFLKDHTSLHSSIINEIDKYRIEIIHDKFVNSVKNILSNDTKMLNISDIYEIFSLMNKMVFFDNFITVINKTQVNNFITFFNKEGKVNLLKYLENSDSTKKCIDKING